MESDFFDVPMDELSPTALDGLIDEFITRDSTVMDASLEQKRDRVLRSLKNGKAVITFNMKDGSSHILTRDEFDKITQSK